MKNKDITDVEKVKLHPVLGMKPGVWLAVLYAVILVLTVFFFCFLPGLMHGAVRVTFTSEAYNVAVYQDDKYIGGTPFTRAVESGNHVFSFRIGSSEIDVIETKISHPVFLTWLFPRHDAIHSSKTLNESAFGELSSSFLSDASSYSRILEYDRVHVYPKLFERYAKAVKGTSFDYDKVFETACLFITTEEMLDDAKNSATLLGIGNTIDFNNIASYFSDPDKGLISYDKCRITGSSSLECPFFVIKGVKREDGTSISEICITENQYAQFIHENPQFDVSNKKTLEKDGIVDSFYLNGISLSTSLSSSKPVRNISYNAACAFCSWLGKLTGKNVFIPTDEIWTSFCKASCKSYRTTVSPSLTGEKPYSMLGGVWEMTSTPFIPLRSLAASGTDDYLSDMNVQTEITVKGGSFVNRENSVSADTVGSLPTDMCSDYLGFRIAWK